MRPGSTSAQARRAGSAESMGQSAWRRPFTPVAATRPWRKRRSSAASASAPSKRQRAPSVAAQRVWPRPKRAPAARSSSSEQPTQAPDSMAAASSASASAPVTTGGRSRVAATGAAPFSLAGAPAAEAAALVAMATSAALAPESLTRRLVMPVKPRAEKAATTRAGSNVGNLASARSSSMGASVRMVATRRLRRASSTWARRFSPILPLTSSAWAMTSSRLPYCTMRAAAFLGPMPGTPGMLSEVSPLRP